MLTKLLQYICGLQSDTLISKEYFNISADFCILKKAVNQQFDNLQKFHKNKTERYSSVENFIMDDQMMRTL